MSADYHQVKHMAEVYLRPSQGRIWFFQAP